METRSDRAEKAAKDPGHNASSEVELMETFCDVSFNLPL